MGGCVNAVGIATDTVAKSKHFVGQLFKGFALVLGAIETRRTNYEQPTLFAVNVNTSVAHHFGVFKLSPCVTAVGRFINSGVFFGVVAVKVVAATLSCPIYNGASSDFFVKACFVKGNLVSKVAETANSCLHNGFPCKALVVRHVNSVLRAAP